MSDTAPAKESTDHFWSRVRTALGALRPSRQQAYGQAVIARTIGMRPKLGVMIDDELQNGWERAAGMHVSLSLLVIEIDQASAYFAAYDPATADESVLSVMQAIVGCLPRPSDCCLRFGRSGFVVVLPDLPALMARTVATKISDAVRRQALANKQSHAGILTVSLGLAVTNPHGTYDRKFFEAGAEALNRAQRKGLGYLQAIDLRPALDRKRKPGQRVLNAA